jgi:hypothetical protein
LPLANPTAALLLRCAAVLHGFWLWCVPVLEVLLLLLLLAGKGKFKDCSSGCTSAACCCCCCCCCCCVSVPLQR